MNNKSRIWQGILILLLLLLVGGGAYVYTTGTNLRQWIMGTGSAIGEAVGKVEFVSGQLKRQPHDALEFIDAPVQSDVFNEDTVITGENDSAKIRLFDGTLIELGPGSLVRLAFENSISLAGIQRRVLVDVVSGTITTPKTQAASTKVIVRNRNPQPSKPAEVTPTTPTDMTAPPPIPPSPVAAEPSPVEATPEPSPSPVSEFNGLKFTAPRNGSTLAIAAGQLPPLRATISFTAPEDPAAELLLLVEDSKKREILKTPVTAVAGLGNLTVQFDRPGKYQMSLLHPDGSAIRTGIRSSFTVAAEFKAIDMQAPLVAGESIDTNAFRGKRLKDFDVSLRWSAYPEVTRYQIKVTNASGTQLLSQTTEKTQFDFPKSKVYAEPIYYQIFGTLPSGYVATSARQEFLFNFLSPQLTLPKSGTSVSAAKVFTGKKTGVLFTWQRTSFTQSYDFEIAADPEFRKVLKTLNLKENFVVFKNLKPGDYYWRARSLSSGTKSPAGVPFKLTVAP